jgi:hypothetical protein
MARQAGITPIIMTQAPTKSYTVSIYNYSQKWNDELDSLGLHSVDWGGVVDAQLGDGQPILSIMYDNVHYKEAAHKEIANAFPPTLFDNAYFEQAGYAVTQKGSISTNTPTTASGGVPIGMTVTDITTFTQFCRFKKGTAELQSIMSMSPGARVFMDAAGGIIWNDGVGGNLTVDSSKNWADNTWHSVGATYSPIDQKIKIYVDGVLKYTTTVTIVPSVFGFAGRGASTAFLKNAEMKDFAIYRTRVTDQKMMSMHLGTFSKTSLEVYSPGHDKNVVGGMPLINLAPTSVNLRIDPTETGLTSTTNPSM